MMLGDRFDVFLAYSRRDLERARPLIDALRGKGISLWFDTEAIPLGVAFDDYLIDAATQALCILVLWTPSSVNSEWVLREAEIGLRRNRLLPALLEDAEIPGKFLRFQMADLRRWTGDTNDPGFERLMHAVRRIVNSAPSDAEHTRIVKESVRGAELRAESLFQTNLRRRAQVEFLTLARTQFFERASWNLQPGINVLLGRNGFGKTLLLRTLVALLQYDDGTARAALGDRATASVTILLDDEEHPVEFAEGFFDEKSAVGKVPVLAIPDIRFLNRSQTTLAPVDDRSTTDGDRADLARFGAWHFLAEQPYENMIQSFLFGLCLDYVDARSSFAGEQFTLIRDVVRELTDGSFDFDGVERQGRNRFTLYVRSEGNEKRPLPIQKASQGTASVIALIGLIYEFLKSLRPNSDVGICNRAGIVVIDEIDAHLHPQWQQKLVAILRTRFPAIQFILTAHNPIVVAGCLEDEVSVLRRDPERGFTIVQFPNDFIGWQNEEIYRRVFDIEGPDATYSRFDALRPFKAELQAQAAALAAKPSPSGDETLALENLEQQLLYIDRVEQARRGRLTHEELERDNRALRERVSVLEAGEAQREVDALRQSLTETTAAAQARIVTFKRRAYAAIGVLLAMVVLLMAWVHGSA